MKQKEVFKKIGGIIQELSDQYEYLQTVEDNLNDLELELFVSNAHFLTDHIEILCKLNLQNNKRPAEKYESTYEQRFFEPVVQQMRPPTPEIPEIKPPAQAPKPIEVEITNNKRPEEKPVLQTTVKPELNKEAFKYERPNPEAIRHELLVDDTFGEDDDEQLPIEKAPLAEPLKEENPVLPVNPLQIELLIDEIKKNSTEAPEKKSEEDVLTINQKISAQMADNATVRSEQLNLKPISDIKLAITLNDKLLYVKDLFNGYNLAYAEAIEILNRFNTFEEASRFLKTNYVTKNNWDSKPATTEKFYALLKRRYA